MKINSTLIQKARIIKRMTREDLSASTGIAMAVIAKIESEVDPRRLRPSTLGKIADALGLQMEEIVIDGDPIATEEQQIPA